MIQKTNQISNGVNTSIFKSYDIRGVYPQEINEDAAYKIGQAFVEYSKAKRVAVGQDARLSSPHLYNALAQGIVSRGADVYNIGQVPTECVYFSVGLYGYESGIMITASHNPKEYNGFKMIKKGSEGVEVIRGKDIADIVEKSEFSEMKFKGRIKDLDFWPDFKKHIFSFIDIDRIRHLKIVIDAGNGVAGKAFSYFSQDLPTLTVIPLNFNPDGNFPLRPPNPLIEGAAEEASRTIVKEGADMGFMFDGDADRIFLLDEKGSFVPADITLLVLAKHFLTKYPGSAIAYNLLCSRAVPEFIKKWGGNPVRTKVGFVNVREGIIKEKGVLAGEVSGHYCFKDNFYFDSGFMALLNLLQIFSESNKKISEIISEFSLYNKSSELNFEIEDKEAVLNKIKKQYSDGKQDYLDGVTVEYKDWWFNVRSSQTEPLLRLTIEADSPELLGKKKKELTALIGG